MSGGKSNLPASVAARLLHRARATGDVYQTLLTSFCFERFLYRLGKSDGSRALRAQGRHAPSPLVGSALPRHAGSGSPAQGRWIARGHPQRRPGDLRDSGGAGRDRVRCRCASHRTDPRRRRVRRHESDAAGALRHGSPDPADRHGTRRLGVASGPVVCVPGAARLSSAPDSGLSARGRSGGEARGDGRPRRPQ